MRHCDCTRCCLYSERVQVFLMIPRWSLPPYSNWLWERLATSNLVRAVGLRHHSMEQHLLDTCSTVLLRSHMSCVQHSDTITYLYYVWCATNRTAPFWVSLGTVALPNRLFDMEFYLLDRILHCDALRCRADSTRTFLRCSMNPCTSTWGIFRYSMNSARTWVYTHYSNATTTLQPFLPSHMNSSPSKTPKHLSALFRPPGPTLLCSTQLHTATQLHSYTATQLHSYIQLHSYTVTQLYSYTATQLHRQTDRQTDRDRQYRVHGLASKCTYAGCGHHVYLPRHMAMGMDCHLFAYLADESPLLHMSIYPYIFQYSSLSTFIHGLLCPFSKHFIYRYFHFSTWKDQHSNRFLSNFNIWSWYLTNLNHIWILSVH